ncbi:bifunctional diaminohydroxyphosphoribosylaminopyrimidine deaminase/5-amino-6-(5-phosphoribosylamino)uracil reductase RibD [Taylorella equigenitalis]|uniref:Riboflavin biosynthesis protein RibD n=1 Tax=Taylorella equigenitalis 14/56 TaxID=1091497 RepID=I7IY63_9BURK|nr:bifunctional diaminohydroxyphosphoribosylaminopyrimidine deaminase/5-amino-6-(5-phosphoribosylamino)uracil reductase RibD [Taylorella equigenitalis]ASY38300.1 bifunctional diaminohydroxyphosphoribosylaminopyrimidine deaminase/5-amino-6-(5-phosphoribosylamino)uracil reductase [Taylorella equigenitalis]ASY41275.1 bifunctional diaminohydroxyphosphoribosylaminopyrimidine deaminase/5-amino-6-(5-phosphoribosylamino)uracil reductase [Taylorella equigenitalis]ASY42764.1 bifunctional diaminohydroxypho
MKNKHNHFMRLAYEASLKTRFLPDPNPCVGCVIVHNDEIIGEGATQIAGSHHAEIMALKDARMRGHEDLIADAILYVTLEPCSHFGRTPPCTDALISNGIKHVVIASPDPNPIVGGNGIRILRSNGIKVEVGFMLEEVLELNLGFFSRMIRGTPWVRTKIASSLDGRISLTNGQSKWITCEESRNDGHYWRARSSIVLTGVGTVLADNPKLNVRHFNTPRAPLIGIVDRELNIITKPKLSIFSNPKVYVFGEMAKVQDLGLVDLSENIELVGLGCLDDGKLNLSELLEFLNSLQVNEIHLEAGSGLNTSFYEAGLIDELLWYQAPLVLGNCNSPFNIKEVESIPVDNKLEIFDIKSIKNNVRLRIRNTESWGTLLNSLKEMVLCLQA